MLQFRQGDLFFEQVTEIPQDLKKVNNVLAVGELSGHAHIVEEKSVEVYQVENNELISHYINVFTQTEVTHSVLQTGEWTKEHNPITLPPGKYKVLRQREFNPFSKEAKRIED